LHGFQVFHFKPSKHQLKFRGPLALLHRNQYFGALKRLFGGAFNDLNFISGHHIVILITLSLHLLL
jgi:hypothetical protein